MFYLMSTVQKKYFKYVGPDDFRRNSMRNFGSALKGI